MRSGTTRRGTATASALGLALGLLSAPGTAGASGDSESVYTFLGWTPEGTGFALHEYANLAACGWIRLVDVAKGTETELCSCDETCEEAAAAAKHPAVVRRKLGPSGRPLLKLKPRVSRVKDKLRFELLGGKKPLLLGTRDVSSGEGCHYDFKFKRALWEPKGRAVAFEVDEWLTCDWHANTDSGNRFVGFKIDAPVLSSSASAPAGATPRK